jgi:hypothetical protein
MVVVALAVAACRSTTAETPTPRSTTAPDNQPTRSDQENGVVPTGERWRSERYGYTWQLPAGWAFIAPTSLWLPPSSESVETLGAKAGGGARPTAVLRVFDVIQVIPGKLPRLDAEGARTLEGEAVLEMKASGVGEPKTERLQILNTDAMRVSGVRGGSTPEMVDVTLFYKGRRRFEVWCFAPGRVERSSCHDAVAALQIDERPEVSSPSDVPRVLHLREARYGLEFDPPDDHWMAIGPRTGANGAHLVWLWNNQAGRQIDVSVFDLSKMPVQPEESFLVNQMKSAWEREGVRVVLRESQLAGKPCHHLELIKSAGDHQDMFIQVRGSLAYGLLVTQPRRDDSVVKVAKAGLRISTTR